MMRNENLVGAGYMMLSMAAFTVNDAFVKLAAETVPLFQMVFLRGVATTLMLAITVHLVSGLRFQIPRGDRARVAWRTFFEVATVTVFLTALINMPLANATAILAALPLFVTLGAWWFLGHPIGWKRLAAITIGFGGVMLIVQPGTDGFNAYSLLALLAVVLITGRDLVTRTFSAAVPSMTVAVITAAAVALFGGVMSLTEPWVAIDLRQAALILGAAVFIIGGYVFSILVMRVGDIGFTAPFRYTSLVVALVLGVLVFGEFPNTLALFGGIIVVATGLFTFWRERKVQHD
jgi:S-adenosylmethionine uptake transporter